MLEILTPGAKRLLLGVLGAIVALLVGIGGAAGYLEYAHLQADHEAFHQIVGLIQAGRIHVEAPAVASAPPTVPPAEAPPAKK